MKTFYDNYQFLNDINHLLDAGVLVIIELYCGEKICY